MPRSGQSHPIQNKILAFVTHYVIDGRNILKNKYRLSGVLTKMVADSKEGLQRVVGSIDELN